MVCRTYTIEKAPTPGFILTADQYEFTGLGPFNTNLHISYAAGAGKVVKIVNSDPTTGDSCLPQNITLDVSGNADVINYSITNTQIIYVIQSTGTDNHDCCTDFNTTTCQYSNYIKFTVTTPAPILTSVDISPINPSMNVGDSITFTASPKDQFGRAMTGITITWSNDNPSVGTINSTTGTFAATAIGSTTITVTATDGINTVTNTTVTTISAVPLVLTSVVISPVNPSISTGQTITLTATPKDQNGNTITDVTVTWVSSDPSKASINPTTGLTTNLTGGTTSTTPITITATATLGNITVTGTTDVTVTTVGQTLTSIQINPSSATVTIGNTQNFSAICKDQDNNAMTCPSLAWGVTDTSKGTVSPNTGLSTTFTAITQGTVTVTASYGSILGSSVVSVVPVTQAGILPNIGNLNIAAGIIGLAILGAAILSRQSPIKLVEERCGGQLIPGVTPTSTITSPLHEVQRTVTAIPQKIEPSVHGQPTTEYVETISELEASE